MKDWKTTLLGISMLLFACVFIAFTAILNTSEGKAIIGGLTIAGFGFIQSRDAGH